MIDLLNLFERIFKMIDSSVLLCVHGMIRSAAERGRPVKFELQAAPKLLENEPKIHIHRRYINKFSPLKQRQVTLYNSTF